MARNTKSCFTVACAVWLLVLFMGSSLLASEARPLSIAAADSASGNAVGDGIEALIEGLYVEAIKAGGGPSPGRKGHGYPDVAFKNSGPSPGGKGHGYPGIAFKNSGPSPGGKGHGYPGIAFKNSGPSPGNGH